MDFIELMFHISPDHGSGLLETMLLMVFLIPIAAVILRFSLKRRRSA